MEDKRNKFADALKAVSAGIKKGEGLKSAAKSIIARRKKKKEEKKAGY